MLVDTGSVRCGDVVKHRPTGEEWVVAWSDGEYLAWAGWPDGRARLSDCDIVMRVSDEGFAQAVENWVGVACDSRPAKVVEMYWPQVQKMRDDEAFLKSALDAYFGSWPR